jgi:hypothetical protein
MTNQGKKVGGSTAHDLLVRKKKREWKEARGEATKLTKLKQLK